LFPETADLGNILETGLSGASKSISPQLSGITKITSSGQPSFQHSLMLQTMLCRIMAKSNKLPEIERFL